MSKIMIWVGQFPTEADFEKYMDQSDFYKWWKEYDEDNKEMRCPFCKELGIMSYDEDFLIMKFAPTGMSELLNLIPADTEKIRQAIADAGITDCNAVICYECRQGISPKKAENTTSVKYLGSFEFEMFATGTTATTAGLRYMTWIGHTDKTEAEFMEYFNQELYLQEMEAYESGKTKKRPNPEHRCQFCKDLGIKFYYPEFLRVNIDYAHTLDSVQLVQSVIKDDHIWFIEDSLNDNNLNSKSNNCAFCYIPNGFRNKKKDQKIFILTKRMKGHLIPPKKYLEDLGNYNGLRYLATFMWE